MFDIFIRALFAGIGLAVVGPLGTSGHLAENGIFGDTLAHAALLALPRQS